MGWSFFGLCSTAETTQTAPRGFAGGSSQKLENPFNLRERGVIPEGKCVYLQAGDPGDFDGYLIAAACSQLQQHTEALTAVVVVPERRACSDRTETDVNKHEQVFSDKVLETSSKVLSQVAADVMHVRGPLNDRNIIPLKFIFSEPEKYGPLVDHVPQAPGLRSLQDLAALVNDDTVTSVVMDVNGSIGYFLELITLAPNLGKKLKASRMPITVMAGVNAEVQTATLPVPGRDPRSTMNAIYSQRAVSKMLETAKSEDIPLLMVTNNVCNKELKFEDCQEVAEALGLQGLMLQLAKVWYGPHLKGKCVPFDWVSFLAMLLVRRFPEYMQTERRDLYVGNDDASILVLKDPNMPLDMTSETNLKGTFHWGLVDAVASMDKEFMLMLAKKASTSCCPP